MGHKASTINMEWMNEWMNEHDQTSHSYLITNTFNNWHRLFLTVLILASLCVPSGLKSNSKYKLNFILERHCEISLNNCCYPTSLILSHLQLPFCWLSLLHSTHPNNRGLGIKLGMLMTDTLTSLSPSWSPFIASALPLPPSNWEPPGHGSGYATCSAIERPGPTTYFCIPKPHS